MKTLAFLLTFIISLSSVAQTVNDITFEKQKLKQALAYGDKIIAANSMYNIIALEGPQSNYKDSLAYLYFNGANYVSTFLVTNDIIKNKPNNIELLEMNAISLESMGVLEKAAEAYNNLFLKTNNNFHAYKLAGLQLALNKFNEAFVSIKKADALPDNGTLQVRFQVNKNYSQNVKLKPAIAYIEGVINMNLKKDAAAKQSFERAIQLFPDFVLAKSRLETLNKKE